MYHSQKNGLSIFSSKYQLKILFHFTKIIHCSQILHSLNCSIPSPERGGLGWGLIILQSKQFTIFPTVPGFAPSIGLIATTGEHSVIQ